MEDILIYNRRYNPSKSIKICDTPHGTLYRKRAGSTEFYLYHPEGKTKKEQITPDVTWADANNLTKTYGSRELWLEYFTTYGKDDSPNKGGNTPIRLDSYHRIKVIRNAQIRHMNMTEYIEWLIDKDDDNNNYAHKSGKFE